VIPAEPVLKVNDRILVVAAVARLSTWISSRLCLDDRTRLKIESLIYFSLLQRNFLIIAAPLKFHHQRSKH
jgi:hypothetical protein